MPYLLFYNKLKAQSSTRAKAIKQQLLKLNKDNDFSFLVATREKIVSFAIEFYKYYNPNIIIRSNIPTNTMDVSFDRIHKYILMTWIKL